MFSLREEWGDMIAKLTFLGVYFIFLVKGNKRQNER